MTTDYVNTILAACPESLLADGNNLAACLGESIADLNTYVSLNYQDADGAKYAVIQFGSTNTIISHVASGEAQRPEFDTGSDIDMALAQSGMDSLLLMQADEDGQYPDPAPGKILYTINTPIRTALPVMKLTPIPSSEDEL